MYRFFIKDNYKNKYLKINITVNKMNFSDVSLNLLKIDEPKSLNDSYLFDLLYNNECFIINSKVEYILNKNNKELYILEKNELKQFNQIFNHLKTLFYNLHDKWFEEKFSMEIYNTIFKEILYINIEENCANLKCLVNDEVIETIQNDEESIKGIPTFEIRNIEFKDNYIMINIYLKEFFVRDHLEEGVPINTLEEDENIKEFKSNQDLETNTLDTKEGNDVESDKENDVDSDKENDAESDKENDVDSQGESIEEIYLNENNLESTNLNISDEDHYIVYKMLDSNIKNNLLNDLNNILLKKNINPKNINLTDIICDSDDDSEDLEDDESFEDNYNSLVN